MHFSDSGLMRARWGVGMPVLYPFPHTHTHTHTHRQTDTHTHTQTDRHAHRCTQTHARTHTRAVQFRAAHLRESSGSPDLPISAREHDQPQHVGILRDVLPFLHPEKEVLPQWAPRRMTE